MLKIKTLITEYNGVQCFLGRFTHLGNPFSFCLYYADGLLIDSGPPVARNVVQTFVKSLDLEAIVLTHHHEDHSGNAAFLSKAFDVPVFMSPKTARIIREPLRLPFYRRFVWGAPEPLEGIELGESLEINQHCFEVIVTPGHSNDHIVLYEPKHQWLFSGDLFLNRRLHYGMRGESIPDLIASIDRVLDVSFESLFCGHAGIVREGCKGLKQKRFFLQQLKNKAETLAEKGMSKKQISRMLLPREWLVQAFSCGEMAPIHLIQSILKAK